MKSESTLIRSLYSKLQTAHDIQTFQNALLELNGLDLTTDEIKNYTDYHIQIREKFDGLLTKSIEANSEMKLTSSRISVITELLSHAMSSSNPELLPSELKEFVTISIKNSSLFGLHEKLYPSNILTLKLILYALSFIEKSSRKELVETMIKGFGSNHIFGVLCSIQSFCNYIEAAEIPIGQYKPSKEVVDKIKATVANFIQALVLEEKITKGSGEYKYLFEQLIILHKFLMRNFDAETKQVLKNLAKDGQYASTIKGMTLDETIELPKEKIIQTAFFPPINQPITVNTPQTKPGLLDRCKSFFHSDKYRNNHILALLGGAIIGFAIAGMTKCAIASGVVLLSCFMLRNVARFKSIQECKNLLPWNQQQTAKDVQQR